MTDEQGRLQDRLREAVTAGGAIPDDVVSGFDFNTRGQQSPAWLDRADKCADLFALVSERLQPSPAFADIGCGDEKLREVFANRGLDIDYTGFDLRPQSERVVPFDVMRDELPGDFDVVAAMGLIEYIDIPRFFRMVRDHARFFIVSHATRDLLGEKSDQALTALGWVNYLTRSEIEAHLAHAALTIEQRIVTADGKTALWLCS